MSLDFPYTCPDIDRSLSGIKSDIDSELIDMITECCPLLPEFKLNEFVKPYIESLYERFSESFEAVRSLNDDMRSQAELQINALQADNEQLLEDVRILEEEKQDLVYDINKLKDEIEDLKSRTYEG